MIKLVVCDVDGTLLKKGEKELSQHIKSKIKNLINKGIMFAVASGRAYHELKRLFEDISDEIYYIPSDGGAVIYKEKTYYKKPILPFVMANMVKPISLNEGLSLSVSGKYITYILSADKDFIHLAEKNLNGHFVEIEDISEINEDIYKISFYGQPKSTFANKILSGTYNSMLKRVYDEHGWNEFVAKQAGKESAVECMMKSLKIKKEALAVIGDDINDVQMLGLTENSVAVTGSHQKAREASKHKDISIETVLDNIIGKGEI
ncbi:MAG: HAD-IIB family hydrolase [Clostridia bacterium]|nr:HAD-IIB family hydrolase [Clostridia bacterium]